MIHDLQAGQSPEEPEGSNFFLSERWNSSNLGLSTWTRGLFIRIYNICLYASLTPLSLDNTAPFVIFLLLSLQISHSSGYFCQVAAVTREEEKNSRRPKHANANTNTKEVVNSSKYHLCCETKKMIPLTQKQCICCEPTIWLFDLIFILFSVQALANSGNCHWTE